MVLCCEKIGGRGRLIIIDDGSKDHTFEIMEKERKKAAVYTIKERK